MAYLVGTDEAGYGPNLGPLVIAGTLWHVPEGVDGEELYRRLRGVIAPANRKATGEPALRIGDSKSLYHPGGGLVGLERGVFAALAETTRRSQDSFLPGWRELLVHCDESSRGVIDMVPWYATFERPVPVDATAAEIATAQQVLNDALQAADIQLLAVQTRLIFPEAFNERVQACGSKGQALSLWTLELIDQLLQPITAGSILIQGDKHGGRNRYAGLLQHVFPERLIEVGIESRQQSTYCWGPPMRRVEAQFIAKGERFLPAALASMFAKYLRELAMLAFNEFWQSQVPGIKPTAGYPLDAKRFRREIDAQQKQLDIPDRMLWRER